MESQEIFAGFYMTFMDWFMDWFYMEFNGFYMGKQTLWESETVKPWLSFGCFDMFRPFSGVSTGHVSIKTIPGRVFFPRAQANHRSFS